MNRADAKDYIKSQLPNYLQKQGIDVTKPFHCLNPNHPDKNPSMSYDAKRNKVHCFSCEQGGDFIDLIGLQYNLTDDKTKFAKTYAILGIVIDEKCGSSLDDGSCSNTPQKNNDSKSDNSNGGSTTHTQVTSTLSDESALTYLRQRGISLETAKQYGLSFTKDWISPTALARAKETNKNTPPSTPRIIIPTSESSYIAIDIRPDSDSSAQEQYRKMKEGKVHIFNANALKEDKSCFVVEGEFDALSFLEIGYNAVAIGSTSNIKNFVNVVKQYNIKAPLILALDNDDAGKKATAHLETALQEANYNHIVAENIYKTHKDANDFLVKEKKEFINNIDSIAGNLEDAFESKKQKTNEKAKTEQQNYHNTSAYAEISAFKIYIESTKDRRNISTGFSAFDEVLGGGLFEGLYIIGALTSLGKTTFALQIADCIANQGIDVLYFSLEMSKSLIMSKSISRHTYLDCLNTSKNTSLAKTSRGILDGGRYKKYNSDSLKIIEDAYESYKAYAKNLYLREGFGSVGIDQISKAVENHIKYTGKTPIVFIDYLQILAPYDAKTNEKQNIDKSVLELKRISRDYNIPIIGISSLNRASYKDKISIEAFKESGVIEYASDVLIGLQFTGVGEKNFDINIAKKCDPRDIELIIIKNRNGISGACLGFKYYPKFNYFQLNKNYTSDLPDSSTDNEIGPSEQINSSKIDIIYDIKNRDSLSDVLKNLDKNCIYGLDIETTGLKATSSKIALLQIYNPKDDRVYIYQVINQPINEAEELLLSDINFVAHNASFENSFMPYLQNLECSMLLYHAVRSNRDCGLADLESVTGISYKNKKQMQTSNWSADILTTEQLEYAAKDAKVTYIIWDKYKDKNIEVYIRMKQASILIDRYSKKGLPVDIDALQELKQKKEKERESDLQRIRDLGYKNIITPKGFTTKKDLIKTISSEAKTLVDKVRSCNSYINNIIAGVESKIENTRLPINVLICGTETGRLSTVRPNVQNFPRQGFRHIFKASKDCLLIKADFTGQELRMAAALSGEKIMLDAFNNGDDLHALMAAKLNNISIQEFINRDVSWKKSERQKAKAANFGFLYGMGAKKFVNAAWDNYGVELTEKEAEAIKTTFWASYPDLKHWCAVERRKCAERGYALTLGGRKRYFADMDKAYCEQINTAVQGSAADVLLETLIALPPEIEKYLLNTVHDEFIFEVPKKLINVEFKQSIEAAMIQGVQKISKEYPIRDIAEIQIVDTL